jgi:hypothetical protein
MLRAVYEISPEDKSYKKYVCALILAVFRSGTIASQFGLGRNEGRVKAVILVNTERRTTNDE